MVQVVVPPEVGIPQIPGHEPFTLEGILQAHGLVRVNPNLWQKFLMLFGRLPSQQLSAVSAQYGAGKLADLPVHPQKGYSAVTLQLQTPSEVGLDNLAFKTNYVFAAATHAMWVELGTPATVVYEGPVQLNRGNAYFGSALVIPTKGKQLTLTVTGIKDVPELGVLETPTKETLWSPDLVWLGRGTPSFDVAKVTVSTSGAVRVTPYQPGKEEGSGLRLPLSELYRNSFYAVQH